MHRARLPLLVALLAAPLFAQQPAAPDASELRGNNFHSLYFHFTYQYPAGFRVQGSDEKKKIMDRGRDELEKKGVDSQGLQQSIQRTYTLLVALRYPQDQQPSGINPGVAVVVENVAEAKLTDVRAYLNAMAGTMAKAGFHQEGELRPAQYGGRQFYEYRVSLAGQVQAYQVYSCTLLQPWTMCFIFSGNNAQEAESLAASANTLKFDTP
jgi:hypothetical protein